MRLVKRISTVSVAVLALSAMAAAGASAHAFEATGTPVTFSGKAATPQALTTKAGSIVCKKETWGGTFPTASALSVIVLILHTDCIMSNGAVTSKPDEPIHQEIELFADGSEQLLTSDGILATLAGNKCTITIKKQGPLNAVGYANRAAKEILVLANLKEIEYSAIGAGCKAGGTGVTAKDGTYAGNSIIEAVGGGTISWK